MPSKAKAVSGHETFADAGCSPEHHLPLFRAAAVFAALALACFAFVAIYASRASAAQAKVDGQNQQHCDDESTPTDDSGDDGHSQASDGNSTLTSAKSDEHGVAAAASSRDESDSNDAQTADAAKDGDGQGCSANSEDDDSSSDDSDQKSAVDPEDRASMLTLFDFYTDSQHYVNVTTTSIATAPFEGFMATLRRDWVQARIPGTVSAAEVTTLAFNREFSDVWGIGGGFGTARGLRSSDTVGSFQTHFNDGGLSATATIARDLLLASAQTVASNIRQTDLGLSLSYDLSEAINADAEAHHKIFSDGNSDNEVSFAPDYKFKLFGGKLALGYRFSYSSYAENPDNGYWAPRSALSDGLAAAWSFDRNIYYGRGELGLNYDSVRESGKLANGPSSGPGGSAAIAFGLRPAAGTEIETYWTGCGSAGWNSMNIGIAIHYFF
jgi:hypothetical protein